jgi:ribose transport system ATP-binding protein
MKAFELRGISKSFFGVNALNDTNLSLNKGRILGLIGQNGAGKSTLMNIIGGVVQPDRGTMLLNEEPYAPRNPANANQKGIAFIHQELNLFSNLSIAENIFIDHFPKQQLGLLSWIDRTKLRNLTRDLLAQVNLQLAPETAVEWLSPGERQLVEIARALQLDAQIIIFDEPTTSLTAAETTRLFEILNRLREAGKTIIYISHILADVMMLADEIAVLRDGELVATGSKEEFDINRMISLMVGRSIEQLYPTRASTLSQKPLLQAKQLTKRGIIKDISFTLHQGEILGLFGLMGSGRSELARILFGLDNFDSGEIVVNGTSLHKTSPQDSIQHRIAFVTENRREEGLLMNLSIAENIALASLPKFAMTPLQVVDEARVIEMANSMSTALQIKTTAIENQLVKSLSGGNQQKVVIAKWLLSNPSVFIMDEPSRGIDVGAKYEIYSIINDLAAKDASILFISSELEELMMMCDRLLVMSRGEIVDEFEHEALDKEQILRSAFRQGSEDKHVKP